MYVSGGHKWEPKSATRGKAMVEQIRVQELITQQQKQDCGCGCGGSSCGAAKQDCGCGCGGSQCGTAQQELVLVSSAQVAEMRRKSASNGGREEASSYATPWLSISWFR